MNSLALSAPRAVRRNRIFSELVRGFNLALFPHGKRTHTLCLALLAWCWSRECPAQAPAVLASNAGDPGDLLLDNSTVYWGDIFTGQISSVSKNPGGSVTQYPVNMDPGGDIVQDNASLYFIGAATAPGGFVGEHSIFKMSKVGGLTATIGDHHSFGGSLTMGPAGGILYYHSGFRNIPRDPGDLTYGTRVIASLSTLGGSETVLVWDDNGSFANAAMDKAQLNHWLGSGFDRPATDSTYLYWTDTTRIWKMPLIGVSPSAVVSGRTGIQVIAIPTTGAAAGSIFWTEGSGTSYTLRRRKVGGEIITVLSNITSSDRCFAVEGDKVFSEQASGLVQVSINGGAVTVLANVAQAFGPVSVAVDANYLYWSNILGQILRITRQSGGGPISVEEWRQTYFGSPANSGAGADFNDFDHDGIVNLIEFGFGLDPTKNSAGQLPQAELNGSNLVISFTAPAGVTGITYGAGWSTVLQAGSWTSIPDTGSAPRHTFSVPAGTNKALFIQLTITRP